MLIFLLYYQFDIDIHNCYHHNALYFHYKPMLNMRINRYRSMNCMHKVVILYELYLILIQLVYILIFCIISLLQMSIWDKIPSYLDIHYSRYSLYIMILKNYDHRLLHFDRYWLHQDHRKICYILD